MEYPTLESPRVLAAMNTQTLTRSRSLVPIGGSLPIARLKSLSDNGILFL